MDVTDDRGINTLDYAEGKGQVDGDASQTFNMIHATAEGTKVCNVQCTVPYAVCEKTSTHAELFCLDIVK